MTPTLPNEDRVENLLAALVHALTTVPGAGIPDMLAAALKLLMHVAEACIRVGGEHEAREVNRLVVLRGLLRLVDTFKDTRHHTVH
jgi:hypothetical protein